MRKSMFVGFGYSFGLVFGAFVALEVSCVVANKLSKKYPEIFK